MIRARCTPARLTLIWGLTVALLLAEILNVVQVFTPAHAVTVCYCCYCCSAASKQKTAKNPGKTREYPGFSRYFRVLPALDAGDRRGSLPGLPYCCSVGLTLATVVGEPHCCSVVTVNTSNTVQLLTFDSPNPNTRLLPSQSVTPLSPGRGGARAGAAGVRDVCGPESDMPCPPCVCFHNIEV